MSYQTYHSFESDLLNELIEMSEWLILIRLTLISSLTYLLNDPIAKVNNPLEGKFIRPQLFKLQISTPLLIEVNGKE